MHIERKRNKGAGVGQRAASSLLAQNDPSGADSRNRSDQLIYNELREWLQSGQIALFPRALHRV